MNLKVVAFSIYDDYYDDIKIKFNNWPPPRHFKNHEHIKILKVTWRIKPMTKSRASFRVVK